MSNQVNCRNFSCNFNNEGECRLEKITLQDDGSPIINNVICIEAEPRCNDTKPMICFETIDHETVWGIPKEDLPEPERS